MTLRFEGDKHGVVGANGMRFAGERGVTVFFVAAEGLEEGGWFSASEDWGDWVGVASIGAGVGDRTTGAGIAFA
jgi:hypothetical protein